MKEPKFNRIKKLLGILILVLLAVPLITVSAGLSQNNNNNNNNINNNNFNHVRPFPYGMPVIYQQNNSSFVGPFYPPAPYGSGNGATCGPYGCYWNGGDTSYLIASTIADNGW
jgi:4-amino-4-deoxy-L-arabinose transferase-like glycosyltransferase